jgi:hypothetical protein
MNSYNPPLFTEPSKIRKPLPLPGLGVKTEGFYLTREGRNITLAASAGYFFSSHSIFIHGRSEINTRVRRLGKAALAPGLLIERA